MIIARSASLLLLCAFVSACAPAVYTMHDGVHGRVVDARTRQPIAGAEVAVYTYEGWLTTGTGNLVASARSGADGCFAVPAQQRVALVIAGMDFGAVHDTVAVSHAGYQSEHQPMQRTVATPFGPSMEELGSVTLHPTAR